MARSVPRHCGTLRAEPSKITLKKFSLNSRSIATDNNTSRERERDSGVLLSRSLEGLEKATWPSDRRGRAESRPRERRGAARRSGYSQRRSHSCKAIDDRLSHTAYNNDVLTFALIRASCLHRISSAALIRSLIHSLTHSLRETSV